MSSALGEFEEGKELRAENGPAIPERCERLEKESEGGCSH
jgi:hypothetical protein